jgi:hypothetical protein
MIFSTTDAATVMYFLSKADIQFNLGDTAGVNKFYIRDSSAAVVASFDSNGSLAIGKSAAPSEPLDVVGNTTSTGDTYWTTDGSGLPYGSFYGNEIAWSSGALTAPQYKQIADTDCNQGELNLVTYTDAGTTLTVTKAGRYLIQWAISAESNTANTHLLAGIMINSTTTLQAAGKNHVEPGRANSQYGLSGCAILDLAANDVIGVGVGSDVDNITITVDHVNLCIVMVGGT